MNATSMQDEFETLPFAAGETAFAGGSVNESVNESEGGFAGGSGNGWQGEEGGEFEAERGRMPMGGRGGGRPVYRAGARPGRGPVARPSRPQGKPKPGSGPGPRPGHHSGQYPGQHPGQHPGRGPRGPYWGPFYGGWPGAVLVSEPIAYPAAARDEPRGGSAQDPAPAFEPIDLPAADGGDGGGDGGGGGGGGDGDVGDGNGAQEEMPGTLRRVLDAMGTTAPAYQLRGSLDDVQRLNLPRRPGFYLITFRKGNAWQAYSGQTGDLHARLLKHRLGATVLGCDVRNHRVYTAESGRDEQARRNIEMAINRAMLRNHAGVLTNRNAELEMALLGWD